MTSRARAISKAMILAAGQGTRLRPLTDRVPKCMVPVGGKPVLEYTLDWLHKFGVTDVVVNLHHLPEVVTAYFGTGQRWGLNIVYSLEQELLGTAGGVKNVAAFFDGPFFLWYGDNLCTCDLDRLYARHRARGGAATIALYYRDDPTHSGIVGLGPQDLITRFVEKPSPDQVFSHWVNAGVYVLDPQVLDAIPPGTVCDFGRDILPALLAQGVPLYGYRLSGAEGLWWIDTPEDLRWAEAAGWHREGNRGDNV